MYACVPVHKCVCVEVRGQLWCHSQKQSLLVFETRFLIAWNLRDLLASASFVLGLCTQIALPPYPPFKKVLGAQTKVFVLARQVFYQLRYLLASMLEFSYGYSFN